LLGLEIQKKQKTLVNDTIKYAVKALLMEEEVEDALSMEGATQMELHEKGMAMEPNPLTTA
jgi:hypothetical protein